MVVHSCAANQEPAGLLTQLLTMTTTHKFPSLSPSSAALSSLLVKPVLAWAVDFFVFLILLERLKIQGVNLLILPGRIVRFRQIILMLCNSIDFFPLIEDS